VKMATAGERRAPGEHRYHLQQALDSHGFPHQAGQHRDPGSQPGGPQLPQVLPLHRRGEGTLQCRPIKVKELPKANLPKACRAFGPFS